VRRATVILLPMLLAAKSLWAQTITSPSVAPGLSPRQPIEVPTAPYQPLRYDEDWRFLRDPARRNDAWDALKYIPLNRGGDHYLTLGGEARERYEYYRNENFGRGAQDKNGYFLQRYLLHADAHFGAGARAFVQLNAAQVGGRSAAPRPIDRDDFDIQQAFLDKKTAIGANRSATLRVGRQEMVFGSGRFVNVAEGNNVRTRFDGVRAFYQAPHGQRIDGFVTRPTNIRPGIFDDPADYSRLFFGIYATTPVPALRGSMDLYFFSLDSRQETYVQGAGREVRRTIGTRIFGNKNGWDYNFEGAYQFGTFASGQIRAYGVFSDVGYAVNNAPLKPRFGLRANIASGDRDPTNAQLNTFNPLFPALNYYNLSADAGVRNIRDLHPTLDLHPSKDILIYASWDFFWRDSVRDGLYNPSRGPLLANAASRSRYNGSQPELQIRWTPDRHTTFLVDYTRGEPGGFLRDSDAKPLDYFTGYVAYKF